MKTDIQGKLRDTHRNLYDETRREFMRRMCAAAVIGSSFVACGDSNKSDLGANASDLSTNSANIGNLESILAQSYTLSNGVKIPKLGLGLWRIENAQVPSVISEAIKVGYRHFDSAQAYESVKTKTLCLRCGFYIVAKTLSLRFFANDFFIPALRVLLDFGVFIFDF